LALKNRWFGLGRTWQTSKTDLLKSTIGLVSNMKFIPYVGESAEWSGDGG